MTEENLSEVIRSSYSRGFVAGFLFGATIFVVLVLI